MIDNWQEHEMVNRRADEAIDELPSREEVRLVIKYCFEAGGKRTRPVTLLLSNGIAGGDKEEALDAAVAVEFVHNASLLHDDILDRGLIRRGQETPFQRFGYKPSLLSGDLLIMLALDLMTENYGAEHLSRLNGVVKEIINGEVLDVTGGEETTLEEYESCIESKTAVLFEAAAGIGAEIAGADDRDVEALERASLKAGRAYQMVDDLLEFLEVQKEKRALESSITLPDIYIRDRGVERREATQMTLERIDRLVRGSLDELERFPETRDREKMETLMEGMTYGVLEKTRKSGEGTLESLITETEVPI